MLYFRILLLCLLPMVGQPTSATENAQSNNECVILLHGLARTSDSLRKLEKALSEAGYLTVNLSYPSRRNSIEELAKTVIPQSLAKCEEADQEIVHFATHSLGGILVRYYLDRYQLPNIGRVVMLSPPNKGSEVVDELRELKIYQWLNGPAGQQLGTGADGIAAQLGPARYPVGIITGNRHALFDAWFADLIPGVDDGKVSVEGAKLEGMSDFLVLPYSHPFIMDADEVINQSIHFLQHGRFDRQREAAN